MGLIAVGAGQSGNFARQAGKATRIELKACIENDIRHERQMGGIAKAKDRGVKFGRKRELTEDRMKEIRDLRESEKTVPAIIKRTGFSKASVYRALNA